MPTHDDDRKPRCVILAVVGFAVALGLLNFEFPAFPSPNEYSRLYLLDAIVHEGSLAIDGAIGLGQTEDKVVVAGHTYSNKPPGLVLLALPAYATAHAVAHATGRELGAGPSLYVARLFAVTLPIVLWLWLLAGEATAIGLPGRTATAVVAGVGFGTGLLPYGAQLMAHATSAACLGTAAILLVGRRGDGLPRVFRRHLAAALIAGIGVACEYPVAVPAVVLFAGSILVRRAHGGGGRALLGSVIGVAAPAALVLAYNAVVFGNPLDLGYGHHVDPGFAAVHASGVGGFGWPTPAALVGLLATPSKGLFAWSPLLLLAIVGAGIATRDRRGSNAAILAAASSALILFIAGYPNWHAGWTVGPRYLLPVVPLLALLVLEAARDPRIARRALPGLAVAGVVAHGLATLTWPYLPERLANPLADLALPLAHARDWVPAVGGRLGLIALAALVAAAVVACLRPGPALGTAVAAVLLTVLLTVGRGQGEVTFFQAEVFFLHGDHPRAAARFQRLLAKGNMSPAMARHAAARIAIIESASPGR